MNAILKALREQNPDKQIHHVDDRAFRPFGEVIQGFDLEELYRTARELFIISTGTEYVASRPELESLEAAKRISTELFGEFPIQVGCCYGYNTKLNGMEYHKSSEIIGAVTPMVLMLGKLQDVDPIKGWDSSETSFFFVPEGHLIELYATTLHLAPCRVDEQQFIAIIVLPAGTNTPLEKNVQGSRWMKNKWMLAHPDGPAAARGADVKITGRNLSIDPISSR
jgi:hypothetical protein